MPSDKGKNAPVIMQTEGVPTLYANLASVSVSFNDLRVYLGEMGPTEVKVSGIGEKAEQRPAAVAPKLCLICTPEFARSLRDALSSSLARYEEFFGPLRPVPEEKQLRFLLEKHQ